MALLITSKLVKRDPENPGALISKWQQIRETIAKDRP
jgi:hypothetical protein